MHTPYDSPRLDTLLGALANPKRRAIVHDLSLQPGTVGQLARKHGLSLPAMHRHVRELEAAGLILRKKAGRTNFVALDGATLGLLQRWTMQYNVQWGNNAQASLENYISRMKE